MTHPLRTPILTGAVDLYSNLEQAISIAEFRTKAWKRQFTVKERADGLYELVKA